LFTYKYEKGYVAKYPNQFIIFKMPVIEMEFSSNVLFPFFDGLIPEGWLLDIASENWKIKKNDRMGLLLACCHDCIGAVSVKPIKAANE
jgi:serine/threonine-protein kinase HipA